MRWMFGLVVLMAGCNQGTIAVVDDTAGNVSSSDPTGTDAGTEATPTSPWAGSYAVSITLSSGWQGHSDAFCTGTGTLTVDDAGALTGAGSCDDRGGHMPMDFAFSGNVADDGSTTGTVDASAMSSVVDSEAFDGALSANGADLSWSGSLPDPHGDHPMDYDAAATR